MDVNFIQDFVRDTVNGMRPAEIKTLVYRDGGVEISPGNIVPAIIPDRLLEHKRTITIDGIKKMITIDAILKDGDPVVVGRYTGLTKYVVLEKINA